MFKEEHGNIKDHVWGRWVDVEDEIIDIMERNVNQSH